MVSFAWRNLMTRPLRTALALVGLSVPILGVMGLFSLSGGLRNLIGDSVIVSRWHHMERYGYPTPTVHRDEALSVVHAGLEPLRVFSRGRFGAWKYEVSNQDHSFMQGVELADRLMGAGDEPTLTTPALVNGGAFLRSKSAR